jgi:hypothetical protein
VAPGVWMFIENAYTNNYSGGTHISTNARVTVNNRYTGAINPGCLLGTGPVDMDNGAIMQGLGTGTVPFIDDRLSFYGSAGGTNRIYGFFVDWTSTSGSFTDWQITGSNVVWRPGPRDRSGIGVTVAAGMPNLTCVGDTTNGWPTLQIGMKLGGACDRLIVTSNSPAPVIFTQFKVQSNLWLSLDNVESRQTPGAWVTQSTQKYVIVELQGANSNQVVTGRFHNDYKVVDQYTDQIFFTNGYFKSAFITYQGDAATLATSGGNDILIWGMMPESWRPCTVMLIQ